MVIGVTGTNGKSSTVQFTAQLLKSLGYKVGYTTTAGFFINGKEIENKMKMTMPGRFYLQQLLQKMVNEGCDVAIIETSSEGIVQFRHIGINYDVAVFTNLTPEHIESHGSFEKYRSAKVRLFTHLARSRRKKIAGKEIQKVSVVNIDDQHADYFTAPEADDLVTFSWKSKDASIFVEKIKQTAAGAEVKVSGKKVTIPLVAQFQQMNAIAAFAAVSALDVDRAKLLKSIEKLHDIAGRFESITLKNGATVIIDYAYEPYALKALFDSVASLSPKRIIGVHGSAGGGRDRARRPLIGKMAAEHESIVIVTNEDPYDEPPLEIIEQVAEGAREAGKVDEKNLFIIEDRKQAIFFALGQAKKGDVVVLTGKGSEPVMAVANGKKIPWSDRTVVESFNK